MTKRVRIGIVGCGKIAETHAAAVAANREAVLIACCDAVEARAQSLADRFNASIVEASHERLFGTGEIDAVLVCTPHPAHESIVVAAARSGIHALCEKPVAVELEQADRMVEAAEREGTKFGVIFQRRFWPAARRMQQAIADGRLGQPTLGECSVLIWRPREYFDADPWRGSWADEGGGVLMNQAVHAIDLFQWFLGPAVEVCGRIATLRHGEYIDVEDTAVATIRFASGALGSVIAATTVNPTFGFRVTIHGVNGQTVSLLENPESTQGVNNVWTFAGEEQPRDDWEAAERGQPGFPHFHELQIADFVDSIQHDRQPAVTGAEAVKSLEIILAIYESSRTGFPVTLRAGRCSV